MEKLFSTSHVHQRDRFDFWHDVACKHIVDHNSQPECRQSFHADIAMGSLADVGILYFENSPMEVSHTKRHVAQARNDDLLVCRQGAGILALEQAGREIVLEAGDIALLDPMLPYEGRFFSGSQCLVFKVPRRALEARVGKTREMVARPIKPLEFEHSLTSSFLAMLSKHNGTTSTPTQEVLRDQTIDLVALSLAKMMESRSPRMSSGRALLLLRIRAAVEAGLHDPALNAKAVAYAAGISVRYANALLAHDDTSIGRLIQARRLSRCRRAFEDPLQARRTVSEIAYDWGFSDMTHFGRSFKKAFGVPPTEYRRLAKHQSDS